MEIRFAENNDLDKLLDLYKELNPDDQPLNSKIAKDIWDKSLTSDYIKYIVGIDDNSIVASCNIAIILNLTRSGRPYGVIENVITNSKYRRKGIGREVIDYAIQYAQRNNCYKVVLLSSSKRVVVNE